MNESTNESEKEDVQCAAYLKAVADPLRLKVIRALQVGPLAVSDIAELLGQEVGTVSHHLRVLFHANIVQTRREGKYIYYSLSDEILDAKKRKSDAVLDFGCCRLDVRD
ncbi:ArsR/SmtB family transcription factor [Rhodopirellula sp. MGV]|uniref:ArsR/SmtB family transcription factor n=1 Tax=Rhodopirellula sp. MGV TaxID=2023130 RepID=UPI000B97A796|nr:metalloregulator ArsR/SmtB family transcription factor [Rhodopirellula sp. MGV]OYP31176.1 transcriptional regulator [Rhodopirellula sp. MGV]PNY36066.1 ArsR family transcriptional regulator [Rhodopirellula baltica]